MPFARLAIAVSIAAAALPAAAQLRLPSLPSALPGLSQPMEPLQRRVLQPALAPVDLLGQRLRLADELLQREPRRLERDPAGAPIVRGELLLQSPSVALLDAAQAAGFRLLREQALPPLGLYLVTLGAPPAMGTAAALAWLRAHDAEAVDDFNHLLLPAGTVEAGAPATNPTGISASTSAPTAVRVGLVDGGVDARHPALRQARLQRHGCDGRAVPDAHGTAVASLLVGQAARFHGAAPGATLYAADVYCGQPAAGSVDAVLQALAWLAQQAVPVVNISLVGPPNRLLEAAVQALLKRGHLLVAAVGNDGPAAPPLYPASYAGVVGVTAVDARQRVLPEAAQGAQVSFAAPGADLAVAGLDGAYVQARGTSFAAPLVAGLLALGLPQPDAAAAARVQAELARRATDLGTPGRDPVFGQGLVAQDLRVEPAAVNARR
jgi:subtilisin family serine protease